jgi:hypothetical protein
VRLRAEQPRRGSGVGVATLLAAVILLAAGPNAGAISHPSSANARSAATPSLCGSIGSLDRLVVTRTNSIPQNHFHFAFPASVTVTKAAAVRDTATALCALPVMPKKGLHCPADWGITYHLAFFAKGHAFPTVDVDATGCRGVKGLGAVRWVARSPEFWKVLGAAMGLAHPNAGLFAGSRSGG